MAGKHFDLDTRVNLGGENASDITIASQKATKQYIDTEAGKKQDKLSAEQLSNIEKGGTAVQPSEIADMATQTWVENKNYLTEHQDISGKVDKVEGKGLSTEDYTTAEKTKLAGLENYTLPKANDITLGGIKVGENLSIDADGVLSADAQEITVDSALSDTSENPVQNKVINTALNNKQNTITDLATIRNNANAGKTAKDTIDTYGDIVTHDANEFLTEHQDISGKQDVITDLATIRSGAGLGATSIQPGDNISELVNDAGYLTSDDISSVFVYQGTKATVDALPTSGNKKGDVWTVSADGSEYVWDGTKWEYLGAILDLSGYQTKITSTNKLSADLLSEGTTNKLVSQTEKNTWSGKQDAISDLDTIRSNANAGKTANDTISTYGDIVTHNADEFAQATHNHAISDVTNLQTTLNGKQDAITSTNKLSADLLSEGNTNKLVSASEKSTWSGKQDAIADLADIRSGAEAGSTAVQPSAISDMATKTWVGEQGYLTEHQDISGKQDKITSTNKLSADLLSEGTTNKLVSASEKTTWNNKQNAISDLATIRSNATAGKSASDTIATYGDIVTHDADEFLTEHQDISGKADKATTLSGYGITDAYTKTEIDGKLTGAMHYKGTVATVDALPSSGNTKGDVYNVTSTGDNYAWDGSAWDKLSGVVDLSGYVQTSRKINGKALTGDITLSASDVSAVPTTRKVNGKALSADVTLSASDVSALPATTSIPSKTSDLTNDSDFITSSDIPTKLSEFTDDLGTSPVHTHSQYLTEHQDISGKQDTITGAATTITSSNLSASKAVISNASGKIAVSDTTSTELGYVHGVTSAIQTQLNDKQGTISDLATIRSNATAGKSAADTIAEYGDIVSHNAEDFAEATHNHAISDVTDLQTSLDNKQAKITTTNKLSADLLSEGTTNKLVSATEKSTWNGKQNAISDLSTIRSNAEAGKNASDTIAEYGDIVTHNASEFLTEHQDISGKQDASTAVKHTANTAVGNTITPVYGASNGNATALSYTIAKSVPSDAKFSDTTYSAGTDLSLSGTTFNHKASGVTAGTVGTSTATSGSTLAVPYVTYNAQGHVTATGTHTHTVSGFQAPISDLGTIRTNASAGKSAKDTIDTYGDIVTHNADEFLTEHQDISGLVPNTRKVAGKALSADITLSASDVGAAASSHNHTSANVTALTGYTIASQASAIAATDSLNTALGKLQKSIDGKQASGNYVPTSRTVNGKALSANITLSASDVSALPSSTVIPTKTSELTNDSGFLTSHQDISGKQDANTAVKHTANTAVGNTITPVYVDANGNAKALGYTIAKSVPADADFSNTTYTAGIYLSLSGTQFLHKNSGVTAGTSGTSTASSGSTLSVPYVTVDTQGHVTARGTRTHTVTGFLTTHQDISGKADKATSLSGYGITDAYTKTEIDGKLSGAMHFKGTVATVSALPSEATQGDMYNVEATGANYAWDGTQWDKLSENIDLSGYVPTTRKVAGKALSGDVTLSASDVGAVPTSRTVNGKALSANITLSASDVSALPSSTVIPTITDTYSSTSTDGMSGKAVASAISGKQNSNTAVTHTASTAVGNTITPVYIASNGAATALGFTIAKSVPADANFSNTTYSAGTDLSLSGTTFNHKGSGVTAGTVGTSTASSGSTLSVPYVTYNAQGHITATGNRTHTVTGFATSSHTHSNYVPTTRTVNSKALSADITLSASDVGALPDDTIIPSEVTEITVSGWGFTKNAGTVTGINMNGASKGTSGVVDLGTVLTSHQTIKQDGVTGATVNRFGTCSTAAATAAKTVSITTGTFNLEAGAKVSVKFTNANTAGTPTLNVNSKGAKNIFHKGAQITTGDNKALLAGVCDFIYDGTQWHLVGNYIDSNTTYSQGTGISISGTTINHSNSITAGTVGTSSSTSGSSVAVPYVIFDAQGHITATGTHVHSVTGFQATISDLATIRSNASAGAGAADTIAEYGDIVSHDASEFAGASHTHSGYQSTTTAVTHTASTAVGNTITPVYIASDGKATALGYTIAKSVPADANFSNTTYSAGTGMSLSGTTFNHASSVTAGTVGTSTASSGSTITVPYVTYNATGHITATGTKTHTVTGFLTSSSTLNATKLSGTIPTSCYTNTTYTAGTGLSLSGTTMNHASSITAGTVGTSTASSGSTLTVPYVTYNASGHITATGTRTHTVTGFATSATTVTHTASTAVGNTLTPVYIASNGAATAITGIKVGMLVG